MNINEFSHSLLYDDGVVSRFFQTFHLNSNDYRPNENDNILEKAVEYVLTRYSDNLNAMQREFKQNPFTSGDQQYAVGDLITISYSPSSQRYIDYYDAQTFQGYIFFVDRMTDNMFLFNRVGNKIITHSMEREGCHYLGMDRGYTTHISRKIPQIR